VVLVDTRRLADCFGAVDYVEQRGIPFIVALNAFDGILLHDVDEVREALQLGSEVPFVVTDARERESVKDVLVTLVEHAMAIVRQG
ncbi:MAG TPA: ATP/GTP-binding protein, partial [Streptosporangiaceae bacterium]|nr:ATP/GTP-binding protein [Streptosporangiaceae bacterium]